MKNSIKTIGVSLVAIFTFITATAQVDKSQQQVPEMHEQGVKTAEISDEEVEMFAEAFKAVQEENQISHEKMVMTIQEEDFDLERFAEIQQAQMNPTQETEVTDEEQAKLEKLMPKLEEIQEETVGNMEIRISEAGLSMQRYQEIAGIVQQDVELQQKIMILLQD